MGVVTGGVSIQEAAARPFRPLDSAGTRVGLVDSLPAHYAHRHAGKRRDDNRVDRTGVLSKPNFTGELHERLPRRVPRDDALGVPSASRLVGLDLAPLVIAFHNRRIERDLALLDDRDRAPGMRVPA